MDLTKVLALVYFLCSAGFLSQQYLSKCDLNCVPFCSPVAAIVSANAQLIETKANPFQGQYYPVYTAQGRALT